MTTLLLFGYYFSSYTLGIVATIRCIEYRKASPGTEMSSVLALTILQIAVVTLSLLWNFFGSSTRDAVSYIAYYGSLVGACVLSFAIIAIGMGVFAKERPKWAVALNAAISLSVFIGICVAAIRNEGEPIRTIVLVYKDLAFVGAAVGGILTMRDRSASAVARFLRATLFFILALTPIIVLVELFPSLLPRAIPRVATVSGPWLLPAILDAWSIAIIVYFRQPLISPSAAELQEVPFPGLTPRERELTMLLLEGKPYKAIADELGISMPTVKSHISSVYRKTNCSNRLELAQLAKRLPHTKG